MSNVTTTHIGTDQNWQDETTIYWFRLNGTDYGTGFEFEDDEFGIAESGGDDSALNGDGYPLTEGDAQTIAVRRHCVVTDAMRDAGANP